MIQPEETNLKNKDLVAVYQYLKGEISRTKLAERFGRSRTNTYYYVGRAVGYWLKLGILRFKKLDDLEKLGGKDI